ncbi:MAG: hypothetical protein CL678_03500 [Bdellovibrionaceae bacterium]|nr:hypothetical protein [Pseudobdellovibrionaceae bacterium]|tara:strand:+ start:4592 stop:5608 length:1017 start_codon:yes stop_codon:yes gene_type:complete
MKIQLFSILFALSFVPSAFAVCTNTSLKKAFLFSKNANPSQIIFTDPGKEYTAAFGHVVIQIEGKVKQESYQKDDQGNWALCDDTAFIDGTWFFEFGVVTTTPKPIQMLNLETTNEYQIISKKNHPLLKRPKSEIHSYRLNLSQDQKETLITKINDSLQLKRNQYGFIKKNCSSRIGDMILESTNTIHVVEKIDSKNRTVGQLVRDSMQKAVDLHGKLIMVSRAKSVVHQVNQLERFITKDLSDDLKMVILGSINPKDKDAYAKSVDEWVQKTAQIVYDHPLIFGKSEIKRLADEVSKPGSTYGKLSARESWFLPKMMEDDLKDLINPSTGQPMISPL